MKKESVTKSMRGIAYLVALCASMLFSVCSFGQACQNTETFEEYSSDATTFTQAAYVFTITTTAGNPFYVDADFIGSDFGWSGTAADQVILDNSGSTTSSVPIAFGIKTTSGVFSMKSLWMLPSDEAVDAGVSGTVTFTGKLNGSVVFTVTINSATFPFNSTGLGGTNGGYTFVDFGTAALGNNANKVINELDISGSTNYTYFEMDDMVWVKGGAAPVVTTTAATGVGSSTATLNSTVNANNLSTTPGFAYSHTSSTLASGVTSVTATPATMTGTVAATTTASLTGLLPGTVYYYQAYAVNCATVLLCRL